MKRLTADRSFFHFDPAHPPAIRIAPGEELLVEVQDAFGGERDIEKVPTPWTQEWEGHPTPPATGPVYVDGAQPGQTLVVDILEIVPGPEGVIAIQRSRPPG
ncbi:MAG: acetamidase/formamidase family protein [Candidatus Rokubacteria bacterium]|nr:acetamidase/formamidase family protein [Candidatus Rokubacteria bacterium]